MLKGLTLLRVTSRGYEPGDEASRAQHSKLRAGDLVAARVSRPRSLPQLRLYWAVLQHVAAASQWEIPERLHVALKVRLGHYDLMQMPNGKVVPVVHSASFDAMTQDQFQEFMDRAIGLICAEVIPGANAQDLIIEVQAMLDPRAAA